MNLPGMNMTVTRTGISSAGILTEIIICWMRAGTHLNLCSTEGETVHSKSEEDVWKSRIQKMGSMQFLTGTDLRKTRGQGTIYPQRKWVIRGRDYMLRFGNIIIAPHLMDIMCIT